MLRSKLTILNTILLVGVGGITAVVILGAAAVPKRLHSNIDETRTFVLKGNTRPAVARGIAVDQGQVAGGTAMPRMTLHFSLTSAQQADLNQLLTSLQDRRSSQYHKFLTPEQYAARFGMNEADLEKVTVWLENNGFTDLQVARSRTWVSFSGTAGQANAAFQTAIHKYNYRGEGRIANAADPQLPKALEGIVAHLGGLNNFRMKPHAHPKPRFTSDVSGSTFLTPDDWATIYDVKPLYAAGWDGSPISGGPSLCGGSSCSIVVVGQSDVQAADLAAFRSAAGLAAKTVTTIVPPGDLDPGIQSTSGDEAESDLDLEWANGIAPNANVLFVTADFTRDNGVEDALVYAIDQNAAPILTTSYGLCELQQTSSGIAAENSLYSQANAQGMTIVSAGGDDGAADCDSAVPPNYTSPDYPATQGLSVDFPASSPYVTGVGGTELTVSNTTAGGYWSSANNSSNGSAQSYIPEMAWNDTALNSALAAGGGGASALFTKPSWQVGTGVPNDGARDVPDIALSASYNYDALLYCGDLGNGAGTWCTSGFRNAASGGYLDTIGGTSAGAPTFAGVVALLVQKTGSRLGNINANLYTVAQAAPNSFHDITSGSNIVPCTVGSTGCTTGTYGYAAGTGYDQASGLGSIDAFNLVEQWGADIQITSSPTSLTIQAGSSGTTSISVSPLRGFTGAVSFSCSVSSSLANVTCSLPSTTVTTTGTTTLTVTAASNAGVPWWRRFGPPPPAGLSFLLLALVFGTVAYALRKQRQVYVWGGTAMMLFMLGAVSCGGGSSSGSTGSSGTSNSVATAESGTVTVTATSGSIRNNVLVSVSIP